MDWLLLKMGGFSNVMLVFRVVSSMSKKFIERMVLVLPHQRRIMEKMPPF